MKFIAFGNLVRRLQVAICTKLGRSAGHPSTDDESLAYFHEHDAQDNADTSPPADEFVDLRCVWAMEFYTPTHLDALIDGFRKLGWDADNHRSPVDWLRSLRDSLRGDAWLNLGVILPRDSDSQMLGFPRRADLPNNIEYVQSGMYALTPSIVCIIACFVFKEDLSNAFDTTLRAERKTFHVPTQRGKEIYTPYFQKRNHIEQIRNDISSLAATWFASNLPGLFSTGSLERVMPTCELTTLRKADPFPHRTTMKDTPLPEYLRLLGADYSFGAWKSTNIPELKLSFLNQTRGNEDCHAMLVINEDQCVRSR